jgi:hemerythrin
MEQSGYAKSDQHKLEHKKFKLFLEDVRKSIEGKQKKSTTAALVYELNEWFINHINGTDRLLSEHLKLSQQTVIADQKIAIHVP